MKALLSAASLLLAACSGLGDPQATLCLVGWGDYPEQAEALQGAADEWRELTRGEASLAFESGDCSSGSVRVVTGPLEPGTVGHAEVDWIALAPYARDFRLAALHELGHFLVGGVHSDDPRDVMFERHTPGVQSETLTMGDLALWLGR